MSKWGVTGTWLMLVIAVVVFIAALFILGSTIGRMFVTGSVELSIPQIGIICGGITSISVFVRCVRQLKNRSKFARV